MEAVVSIKEKSHAVNEHKYYGWCLGQLQPYRDIIVTIICKISEKFSLSLPGHVGGYLDTNNSKPGGTQLLCYL